MKQLSRRSLISGTGCALALSATGCLGGTEPSEQSDGSDDESSIPSGLATAFEYVYARDGGMALRITRPGRNGDAVGPSGDSAIPGDTAVDWAIVVTDPEPEMNDYNVVGVGTVAVDAESSSVAPDGRRGEFDLYTMQNTDEARLLATDGEILLQGSRDWVESTLDRHEADEATYVEERDGVRAILAVFEYAGQSILLDDREQIESGFEHVAVEPSTLPALIGVEYARTDEVVSYTLVARYAETPTTADAETMERFVSQSFHTSDAHVEVRERDQLIVAETSSQRTPPEERPETADVPRYVEYDAAADELLFRFEQGEQLPVEHYEIEIEGEVYDGDWARGQDTIGEGDVIAIDADAIEPGDDFSIHYEPPDGGYGVGSGTTALTYLPFEADFDPDERTAVIRYVEGPPLEGDRVRMVIGENETVRRPWDGELTQGDSATLSDLSMDAAIRIEYERSDGETARLGRVTIGPPGRFRFAYDGEAETMTISYPDLEAEMADRPPRSRRHVPDQEPLDAGRYEVRIDGEPADRQWSDVGTEISPGDTLTLPDVPVDTAVTVAWIDADGTAHVVDQTITLPTVEFAFDYDEPDERLSIRHDGGQPVDPARLVVEIQPDARTVAWEASGSVVEGDEFVVEDVSDVAFVAVLYRHSDGGRRLIDRAYRSELLEGEE